MLLHTGSMHHRDSSCDASPNPIFIFVDESGNFDFAESGTRHFVMAAVIASAPLDSSRSLQALRYRLLAEGVDVPTFHASEDRQVVRDALFPVINSAEAIEAHIVFTNKRELDVRLHGTAAMYSCFGRALTRQLLHSAALAPQAPVVIIFDKVLPKRDEAAFLSEVKPLLNVSGRKYRIYFQRVVHDANAQVADYIAWAHYVCLERHEHRPLSALNKLHRTVTQLHSNGELTE